MFHTTRNKIKNSYIYMYTITISLKLFLELQPLICLIILQVEVIFLSLFFSHYFTSLMAIQRYPQVTNFKFFITTFHFNYACQACMATLFVNPHYFHLIRIGIDFEFCSTYLWCVALSLTWLVHLSSSFPA